MACLTGRARPWAILSRLNTGLAGSLRLGTWAPEGAPALAHLIERLSRRGRPFDVILLAGPANPEVRRLERVTFPTLDTRFYLVPYFALGFGPERLRRMYNELRQWLVVTFQLGLHRRYGLLYCHRGDLTWAALASWRGLASVVRFLGIADFRRFLAGWSARLRWPLVYAAFKAPLLLVVCSEDGSPGRALFRRCLRRRTPVAVMLNGVDRAAGPEIGDLRARYGLPRDVPLLLFVGRLSRGKGAETFVAALERLHAAGRRFAALMVCGGYDTHELTQRIAAAPGLAERLAVLPGVPHAQMGAVYRQADVYVSLNQLGNLSNTVLEAMDAGLCVVALGPDPTSGADASTERLVPPEAMLRVDRARVEEHLYRVLGELLAEPGRIEPYRRAARGWARRHLLGWEERIDRELELIESALDRRHPR